MSEAFIEYEKPAIYDVLNTEIPRPFFKKEGQSKKVKTGFKFLDKDLTGSGLEKGWFVVFAAGTGIGKTTLMTNIAIGTASMGNKVLYLSLEMTHKEIVRRMDSIVTDIPLQTLMDMSSGETEIQHPFNANQNITVPELEQLLREKLDEYWKTPKKIGADLQVAYYPARSKTVYNLRDILESFKAQGKEFDMVVIDFADRFKPLESNAPYWEAVAEAFEVLPGIAREYNVVIITATEVNKRDAEKGDVTLASLYGSSTKAFGADLVLGIEKPGDAMDKYGESMVRVIKPLKNRHGSVSEEFRIILDPRTLKVTNIF
jgi:replicative DNA helicase